MNSTERILLAIVCLTAMATACAPSLERQLWNATRQSDTVPTYQQFLRQFPEGRRADAARERLQVLTAALRQVTGVRLQLDVRYINGPRGQEIDGVEVPMQAAIAAVLGSVPLNISASGAPDADSTTAVLRLQLEAQALHEGYTPAEDRSSVGRSVTRQYAGARMIGTIALSTVAGTVYARDFSGRAAPPSRIGSDVFKTPRDAPFGAVFDEVVVPEVAHLVAALYGPEPLLGALAHERLEVRAAAISVFGDRADTVAVLSLLDALDATANFRLQIACARALGMIGDHRAAPRLVLMLSKSFDMESRAAAAVALGRIGDACAVEPLLAALDDGPAVQHAAARALRTMTGKAERSAWDAWAALQDGRPCGAP